MQVQAFLEIRWISQAIGRLATGVFRRNSRVCGALRPYCQGKNFLAELISVFGGRAGFAKFSPGGKDRVGMRGRWRWCLRVLVLAVTAAGPMQADTLKYPPLVTSGYESQVRYALLYPPAWTSPSRVDEIRCSETFLQDEDIVLRFTPSETRWREYSRDDLNDVNLSLQATGTQTPAPSRDSAGQGDPNAGVTVMDVLPEPLTMCLLAVGFVAIGFRRKRCR